VVEACSSIVARMWEVGSKDVPVGGSMVIIEVEGRRLWWRIWDSTAN
jgi:hypothetical protein